jgi:hypothetical protein
MNWKAEGVASVVGLLGIIELRNWNGREYQVLIDGHGLQPLLQYIHLKLN